MKIITDETKIDTIPVSKMKVGFLYRWHGFKNQFWMKVPVHTSFNSDFKLVFVDESISFQDYNAWNKELVDNIPYTIDQLIIKKQ